MPALVPAIRLRVLVAAEAELGVVVGVLWVRGGFVAEAGAARGARAVRVVAARVGVRVGAAEARVGVLVREVGGAGVGGFAVAVAGHCGGRGDWGLVGGLVRGV